MSRLIASAGRSMAALIPDGLSAQMRQLYRSRFLRSVAVVSSGTAAAQLITVAFSPVLTRLYGPEAFGILGVFMAGLAFIGPLSNLAYDGAIVLPRTDDEARTLVRLSLGIGLIITAFTAIIAGGFHREIAKALGFTAASALLLLAPLVVLLSATAQPLQQWLVRKKRFYAMSRIAVVQAAVMGSARAAIGLAIPTAPVLLVVFVLGAAFRTLLLWIAARPTWRDRANATEQDPTLGAPASFRDVVARYRDFPFFRAPQIWLTAVSHSVPTLLLAALFGPAAAGFYAIARNVLGLPSTLISGAVGTVLFPRLAEAVNRGEKIRPLLVKTTAGLALPGALILGILVVLGPWLFGIAFGAEWAHAGEYARWLALWLFTSFINGPSVHAIPLLGMQKNLLIFQVCVEVLRVGSMFAVTHGGGSDVAAVAAFSIVGAGANTLLIIGVIASADRRRRSVSA